MFDLETVKAVPIMFAVKVVPLKVYIIFSQSDDIDKVTTASQLRLRHDKRLTCTIIVKSWTILF